MLVKLRTHSVEIAFYYWGVKDDIYAQALDAVPPFAFDGRVAGVFDNMIRRSVPGYSELLKEQAEWLCELADCGLVWDLGCSTGNLAAELQLRSFPLERYVGVDPSDAMLAKARERFGGFDSRWVLGTAQEAELDMASVIVMNFTLQFIPIVERDGLLRKCASALQSGGVVLLSEKVQPSNPALADVFQRLHFRHKRNHGYSDIEIAQKRDALEGVLLPESERDHCERLERAGFSVETVFRSLQFACYLGVKN